ncbi:MAG: ATP-binding protein [Candidatus Eisenbacteria sp.]|nr:ATP-binding protein [Candidatus Eisenbacteria bacterium]
MRISEAIDLHHLAVQDAANYSEKRFLFDQLISPRGKHFVGIVGPRGVGKTVLLKQLAALNDRTFYLSLDTVAPETDVFELVRRLSEDYGYSTFLLDEVHYLPGIDGTLKKLYDFLDVQVRFTSSMALSLHQSAHDLSRRARLARLLPFSFREYLAFRYNERVSRITLGQLLDKQWEPEHLRAGFRFDAYLRGGLMPFAIDEPDVLPLLENILNTIITRDIPKVARLHTDELEVIQKLMRFIGRSAIDGINYSSLSRILGITKYKAEQYVGLLETAFVLQRAFPAGTNVLKEPKVLMSLPFRLLYQDFTDAIGGLREDFFAEAMRQAGMSFSYLKSTRGKKTPDYLLDHDGEKLAIEIGGHGKGREQFKGVTLDRKLIFTHSDRTDGINRPLFLLGYLA